MPFTAGLLRDALRSTRGVWIALLALVAIGTFWNIPARTGEPAVALPAPAIDNPKAAGPLQTAVIAGGCFWGVRRVPAHQGRQAGAVRLLGWREEHRRLREGRNRPDRPRRVGADRFRSERDLVRGHSADLFFGRARSDRARSPGTRRRHAIPLGDLLLRRVAAAHRAGLHLAAGQGACFRAPDRDPRGSAEGVLSGRGLPPGLPGTQPDLSLHRDQRPPQDRKPEAAVSGPVSGEARPDRGCVVAVGRPGKYSARFCNGSNVAILFQDIF